MKNIIIILISILSLSSCKAQKNNTIMQLDIENFKEKTYYTRDSVFIDQYTFIDQYYKKATKKDHLFSELFIYDKNGKLIRNGGDSIDKWYEYNEKGKITKVTDYNLGFSFTLDSLQAYAKRNEIDLLKTRIFKGGNKWELRYIGKYRDISGGFIITLDGKTGEELLVTQKGEMYNLDEVNVAFKYDTIYYKGQPYKQK